MNNRKRLSYLLPRDGHLCGIHVGGCGMRIRNRTVASLDHIFTKSFFKDREDGIWPKGYNKDWNCQPMHQECNTKRGGQIYGFPSFTCSCHWLQIDRTSRGHVLTLHYRTNKSKVVFPVSTEEHNFVSGKHLYREVQRPVRGEFGDRNFQRMVYGPTKARKEGSYRQRAFGTRIP